MQAFASRDGQSAGSTAPMLGHFDTRGLGSLPVRAKARSPHPDIEDLGVQRPSPAAPSMRTFELGFGRYARAAVVPPMRNQNFRS